LRTIDIIEGAKQLDRLSQYDFRKRSSGSDMPMIEAKLKIDTALSD